MRLPHRTAVVLSALALSGALVACSDDTTGGTGGTGGTIQEDPGLGTDPGAGTDPLAPGGPDPVEPTP